MNFEDLHRELISTIDQSTISYFTLEIFSLPSDSHANAIPIERERIRIGSSGTSVYLPGVSTMSKTSYTAGSFLFQTFSGNLTRDELTSERAGFFDLYLQQEID